MAGKQKPWNDKWEIIKELSGGGQGATFLVKPKPLSKVSTNKTFVLKKLKNQSDFERRKRMYREVTILKTIDHLGIPKLFDSNAEQFHGETPLYMVTEFIEGETLAKVIEQKFLELSTAVNFILKLLDIVQYCHGIGIIHRDIKPDNIGLRFDF